MFVIVNKGTVFLFVVAIVAVTVVATLIALNKREHPNRRNNRNNRHGNNKGGQHSKGRSWGLTTPFPFVYSTYPIIELYYRRN